ncbi:MAG: hypothetical protein IKC01_05300 [Clostridia bacterium]|nr:hypothetical protein [Clostridia bacterium]
MRKARKTVMLILITIFFWSVIKVGHIYLYNHFVKPSDFYQTAYDYSQGEEVWFERRECDSLTQTTCLNLLTILENGRYDEFKTEFIKCYENVFNSENCYLIIRRVYVNNTKLSLKEKNIMLEVLNEIVETEKKDNNKLAIIRNYALQQEILYSSGRILSANKVFDEIEKYS